MEKVNEGSSTRTEAPLASKPKRRGRWKWILAAIPLVAIGVFVLYVLAALNYSYSSGERAGYLQKFSHKGWLCKTWEGEIAMTTVPGTAPVIFDFTVRDPAVAEKIRKLSGRQITIHYEQHKGLPTTCFGDTEYFVVSADPVGGP